MNIINIIATLVCGAVTIHATAHKRYVPAVVGFVITVGNMWMAIFG